MPKRNNPKNDIVDIEPVEINETTNLAEQKDAEEKQGNIAKGFVSKLAKGAGQAAKTVKSVAEQAPQVAKDTFDNVSDAAGETMLQMRINHYNPIFPDELYAEGYDMPALIILEDGDQRKGIDVCEGAVAWLSIEQKMEVLHLYFTEVEKIGFHFYPMPKCGAAYYIDAYDPSRYIDVSKYVDTMRDDYFTELRQVAYLLGAKFCQLEAYESQKEYEGTTAKAGLKGGVSIPGAPKATASISGENSSEASYRADKKVVFTQRFEGNADPICPELKRLAHDNEVAFLIDTRCNIDGRNIAKEYNIEVSASQALCLSEEQARKIDAAVKGISGGANGSLRKKVSRELHSKLRFTVEF